MLAPREAPRKKEKTKIMKIVINTPAGNVGRVVTDQLLQAKEEVVIISRHPEKVADFVTRGARLVEGSIDDPLVLDRALQGADALYWANPGTLRPDFDDWSARAAQTAADAVKSNEVKRVVVSSSWGAQHGPGAGPVGVLLAVETAFKAAAPHVTILRSALFMEDFVSVPTAWNHIGAIAARGTIFGPFHPAKKIPMVAARDVGARAAEVLLDTRWSGFRVIGVHGPEDLDLSSVAHIIGEGIGRPVKYVEVPLDQVKQGMLDAGIPASFVEYLMDMYTEQAAGRADPAELRSAETTTTTSLLEFSRAVIKPAVEAAAGHATSTGTRLEISRRFDAPPERVFDAWLTKSSGEWLSPAGAHCEMTALEPRVGGHYQMHVTTPDGRTIAISGAYHEIARPQRLVLTWTDHYNTLETIMTLTFRPDGAGTMMIVRQDGFPEAGVRDRYNNGWTSAGGSFDKLAAFLAKGTV